MAVTIKMISELAGVSIGTVDRALHNRGRVNPEVAERIRKIAAELNYRPNVVAKGLVTRNKNIRISVILHIKGSNPYFDDVICGIQEKRDEIADFGIHVEIFPCPDFQAEEQLKLINAAIDAGTSAIIIVPINDDRIRRRLNELHAAGFPVVLLTNLLDDCDYMSFIGCNYTLAGEIAGGLLHLIHPGAGNLLLFSPSFQMYGHIMRAEGLKRHLAAHYPDISLVDTIELTGQDIPDYRLTEEALRSHPDIQLIVCPGASGHGNLEAIKDYSYSHQTKILCYDSSNEVIRLIREGVVTAAIVQCPRLQGQMAVATLFDHLTGKHDAPPPHNHYIPTKIYFLENLSDLENS